MKTSLASLAALLSLATSAYAHATFQKFYINGVSQGLLNGIRVPAYNGPIENVNSNDIICNGGINPYIQPVSQTIHQVPQGATVGAEFRHGLGDGQVIDPSHKGPILAYLAKVPSATQTTVTGLNWFKIYEDGYNPSTGKWAVDTLIANDGVVHFKLPECIPAGEYLLRVELIALHAAGNYPGAQFYMGCAQINILGGGNANPPTVSFPGAYSGSDPGIKIGIYYPPITNYIIPGPRPFTCNGQQPTTQTTIRTTTPTSTSTSSSSSSRPTTPTSTSVQPTSTGTVPQWGQCGGIGYNGPTVCQSPYRCVKSNDYYSQCLA